MNDERIRDLLAAIGAVTEDFFCTIHGVENDLLTTIFSSHPVPEELGSWQPIGAGIVGWAAEARESVSIGDVHREARYLSAYPFVRSEFASPVLIDARLVGVINFESTAVNAFTVGESRLDDVIRQLQEFFLPVRTEQFDRLSISEAVLWRPAEQENVRLIVDEISEALLRQLARTPALMHQLSPRKFEELVARVLSDLGLKVTLTPPIKDGGFDMFAELSTPLGTVLTLVECKRYSPRRPVTVEIVRNLYGVLNLTGATRALIATTSRFTGPARAEQDAVKYRLELRDYEGIAAWLRRYDIAM